MKPLAVTCGDPAGIGPEVIAGWLRAHPEQAGDLAVLGPALWLETLSADCARIPVGEPGYAAEPGRPEGRGARVALAALERAAEGTRQGLFSGVVSGPVSKARLAAEAWGYPGQTEFFAARWGGDPVMAFVGGGLRVALATWHIPLREVGAALTPEVLRRTVAAAEGLARSDGVDRPRVGVCGLNPHAGEEGLLGTEERDLIDPVLDGLRERFPGLSGCLPADSLFARHRRGEFDVVVALYHDQGLAPLKALAFEQAVNITLGLPHVRTSPDHGTAFGLAGKGGADFRSFGQAVAVARRLTGPQSSRRS